MIYLRPQPLFTHINSVDSLEDSPRPVSFGFLFLVIVLSYYYTSIAAYSDLRLWLLDRCVLLIDKHGKQFHYLQFLSIICVCKRDAIARNQEAICRAIFDDSKVLDKVRNVAGMDCLLNQAY